MPPKAPSRSASATTLRPFAGVPSGIPARPRPPPQVDVEHLHDLVGDEGDLGAGQHAGFRREALAEISTSRPSSPAISVWTAPPATWTIVSPARRRTSAPSCHRVAEPARRGRSPPLRCACGRRAHLPGPSTTRLAPTRALPAASPSAASGRRAAARRPARRNRRPRPSEPASRLTIAAPSAESQAEAHAAAAASATGSRSRRAQASASHTSARNSGRSNSGGASSRSSASIRSSRASSASVSSMPRP